MTRDTLLRLDRALDAAQSALDEIPYHEWSEFVVLQARVYDMKRMVANKLDALAAGR
jgi:hypothetical protein